MPIRPPPTPERNDVVKVHHHFPRFPIPYDYDYYFIHPPLTTLWLSSDAVAEWREESRGERRLIPFLVAFTISSLPLSFSPHQTRVLEIATGRSSGCGRGPMVHRFYPSSPPLSPLSPFSRYLALLVIGREGRHLPPMRGRCDGPPCEHPPRSLLALLKTRKQQE